MTTTLVNPFRHGAVAGGDMSIVTDYPEAGDNMPEGGLWGAQATLTLNGRTLDSLKYQYSTDYTGDEGAATWNDVATDANMTEASGVYTYSSHDGAPAIPNNIAAVRFWAKDTDTNETTSLVSATSGAKTLVVSEDFTAANGTLFDTSYTLDTGGTVDHYHDRGFDLEIQNNRLELVGGDISWSADAGENLSQLDAIAECIVNNSSTDVGPVNTCGPSIAGRSGHSQSNYNNIRAMLTRHTGTIRRFYMYRATASLGWVDVESSTSDDTDYKVVIQLVGNTITGALFTTGGTLIASLVDFSGPINAGYKKAAVRVGHEVDQKVDDWKVWTF